MIAGDDTKAIEQLARYQTPQDFWKSHAELRATVSKRAEPARLADNATPEQIGAWRKALGVPEVAPDAKPDAYLAAYKIEVPKGYEMNQVEAGMLGDFAKLAYEQGHSPREVKAAAGFFFTQQQANVQALNRLGVDFQKVEQDAWRDEVGSKEYEVQIGAGSAWLHEQFKGNEQGLQDLLGARLPSGGRLGDSAWFGKLIAQQAMGAGFTDRIEANALESGGRSLEQQIREVMSWRQTDRARYDEAAKPGGKLAKLQSLAQSKGIADQHGRLI